MAIYQRGKSYYYDFVHKGQRYTGCIGPVSRTVAKEEEHRKKTEVIEGRLNPAKVRKSPRFDAFAEEYLEWVKANRKPLTYVQASVVVKTLTATFGPKRLNEVTAWHMEQYKKARKDAGMAPATINKELAFLKGILNKAVAWKKLAEHPGKDVKALRITSERTRFWSEEEEARVLTVCSPAPRRIIEAGLLTGFRRQELIHLRPEDVRTRFFRQLRSLTDEMAQHLSGVGYEQEMAFAAVVGEPESERVVGTSSYFLDPRTGLADVAYMVDPEWQGVGLGTLLQVRTIEYARAQGIRGFKADVLMNNAAMLAVFRRSGCQLASHVADGVVELQLLFEEPVDVSRRAVSRRSASRARRSGTTHRRT